MKFTVKEIELFHDWIVGVSMFLILCMCILIVNTTDLKVLLIELTFVILTMIHLPKNKVEVYNYFKGLEEMEQSKQDKSCKGCIDAVFPLPNHCKQCTRMHRDLYRKSLDENI